MVDDSKIYQFKIFIKNITPMIWRRFLIRSSSTLKDLHYVIQILMGWTDYHLNEFIIHGCRYTIPNMIGNTSGGGRYGSDIALSEFKFRKNIKISYVYDFTARWEFELRLEKIGDFQAKKIYPICIVGSGASPEEECGGPYIFNEMKSCCIIKAYETLMEFISALVDEKNDKKNLWEVFNRGELRQAGYWLNIHKYERKKANKFLTLYAKGDKRWQEAFDEVIYL